MVFYLSNLSSKEDLKRLFIEKWNWEPPHISRLHLTLPDDLAGHLRESSIIAEKLGQKIVLIKLINIENHERQLKSIERKLLSTSELKILTEESVFIFESNNFNYIDFIKADKVGTTIRIRKFSISPENRDKLRTPSEQLEILKLGPGDSIASIKNKIEEAFSVESVTEKFYEGYINLFGKIKSALNRQKVTTPEDKEKSLREYVHQLLNRIMFLYFVQKRGCFSGNNRFLADFWDGYKTKFRGHDKFHKDWLNVLFFEALCLPAYLFQEKPYLGQFNKCLKEAPYLNGGLFEKNDLDKIEWYVADKLFEDIFDFFESFNFTVEESTPFDIDISINPEMLGNIYEHLVNIEEQEEQARAGIFYTPKAEIELMLRLSLVEFLFGKLNINKEKLYYFMFSQDTNKNNIPFNKAEAEQVLREIDQVVILDPACGSGHYLVVTSQILYQLKERLWNFLNAPHLDRYEEKKRIIERNIYGNDIKEWAVEIAKLRLWLELFVDADLIRIKDQDNPLLPNLSFKIRCGDSLVQRIGHNLVPIRKLKRIIERTRKSDLKEIIQKKENVYKQGSPKEYMRTLKLEKSLLLNALNDWQIEIENKLSEYNRIEQLIMEYPQEYKTNTKRLPDLHIHKEEIDALYKELNEIEAYKKYLAEEKENNLSIIWDLAFAEIFQMKNGFDIVIANPPYVRQESIEDLQGFYKKQEYKDKLIEQIKEDWKYDYEGKLIKSPVPNKFDKKCDLYVYFYLKGLKLLNPHGVLCYISSNSWLDVGYGKILQEVLLKTTPIVSIFDNQAKRSFKQADINTIIAIIKAPEIKEFSNKIKSNEVKFVLFKRPFEEILSPDIFKDLDKPDNFKSLQEGKRKEQGTYRIHVINQAQLYIHGRNIDSGLYEGNKWGGKYLRAPEIYWKILEKGRGKLVRLGDIAEVRRGFTTGANEFFYVEDVTDKVDFNLIKNNIKNLKDLKSLSEINKAGLRIIRNKKTGEFWLIEKEHLILSIKSPKELKTIFIKSSDLNSHVISVHVPKKDLKAKKIYEYINWGETKRYNKRQSCKQRKIWYDLGLIDYSIVFPSTHNPCWAVFLNYDYFYMDKVFYGIKCDNFELIWAQLNSTFLLLQAEINGYSLVGGGGSFLTVEDLANLLILISNHEFENKLINHCYKIAKRPFKTIFEEIGLITQDSIRNKEPNPLPDRKALDDIVFDALGLTEEERKEVYWAVAELVQNRLQKARSV
jgi:hypothetical protein